MRQEAKIREGGKVKANIVDGKLVLEPVPSIEELLRKPVLTSDVKTAERLSEEAQKEAGVYGVMRDIGR